MKAFLIKSIPVFIAGFLLCFFTVGLWYKSKASNCQLEKQKIENAIDTANKTQQVKIEYVEKINEVEKIVYKDRIEYIDRIIYDENKSNCDNAMSVIRANF